MPTTTNYGWTTPADTDLVKDGASAIRTLGNSIDSTLKTQIDAQIPDSLLTTKGDIIAATGASTPARLGVGTNGQYLQADSTASTGLKWATVSSGGMTSIASGTLSGSSLNLTSISSSYKDLVLNIVNPSSVDGGGGGLVIKLNGATTNYSYVNLDPVAGLTNSYGGSNHQIQIAIGTSTTQRFFYQFVFPNYASTTSFKVCQYCYFAGTSKTGQGAFGTSAITTTALNQIELTTGGAGNFSGGTYELFGVQ